MKKAVVFLVSGLLLCGCASVGSICLEREIKNVYASATQESKNNLLKDLTSGKIQLGAAIDDIRANYGNPDDLLVAHCTARLIYRLDSGRKVTLWFDDGWHLSMWSN